MEWPGLSGDNEDVDRFLEGRFGQLVRHEYERGLAHIERFLSQNLEVRERLEGEDATLFDMHDLGRPKQASWPNPMQREREPVQCAHA